jgi:hypothetical protein
MTVADKINLGIALAAGASVIVTTFYVIFTRGILKANRDAVAAMREQTTELSRPRVAIWPHVRIGTQILCLSVKNVGNSSAHNLRMEVDRDFYVFGEKSDDKNLRLFNAFQYPIDALPPGAELLFYLHVSSQLFAPNADPITNVKKFSIRARYEFTGREYDERTDIDFNAYYSTVVPQDVIAEEVEKVHKELKELRRSLERRQSPG